MLNGQFGDINAAKYLVDVYCRLPEVVHRIEAIRKQPSFPYKESEWINCRQTLARRQRHN